MVWGRVHHCSAARLPAGTPCAMLRWVPLIGTVLWMVDGVKPGDRLWSATPAELQALAAAGDDIRRGGGTDLRQNTPTQVSPRKYARQCWQIRSRQSNGMIMGLTVRLVLKEVRLETMVHSCKLKALCRVSLASGTHSIDAPALTLLLAPGQSSWAYIDDVAAPVHAAVAALVSSSGHSTV